MKKSLGLLILATIVNAALYSEDIIKTIGSSCMMPPTYKATSL